MSCSTKDRALRVLSIRDVSERERAEEERRALEQNLRQAQKMEAVGRLAGGVAHDFSNVLAVILGYSELLMQDLPREDERSRESAEGIVEAAHRAAGVTRQLLTLSRKKLLRPEVLSLNEVVQNLGKLLSRAIGERIELTTRLADGALAGPRRRRPARAGAPEPRGECARRDARRRPARHRDRQRRARHAAARISASPPGAT